MKHDKNANELLMIMMTTITFFSLARVAFERIEGHNFAHTSVSRSQTFLNARKE